MIKHAAASEPSTRLDYERGLFELARERLQRGLAPPAEVYRVRNRAQFDWSIFPEWARPIDPEVFEDCCHEG